MAFLRECLDIAPTCVERMVGREGYPLLGEAGLFLTGLSVLRDHYLIRRNRPDFHILLMSHDEGGALLLPEGAQPIPAGSLVFLPARVPGGLALTGASWQTSWVLLDDVPRWHHLHRLGHLVRHSDQVETLHHLLALLHGERPDSPLLPDLLTLLLSVIERSLKEEGQEAPERRLQHLFRVVEGRLAEPWSVRTLAALHPCSVPHLHRLCQQWLGCGPMAHLTRLRMEKAKQWLLYTDWSLSELAARVGYSDGANFANRFRRHTGVTPGEFRRSGRLPVCKPFEIEE